MVHRDMAPPAFTQPSPNSLTLSGRWTARGVGAMAQALRSFHAGPGPVTVIDASGVESLDTAGAWILQELVVRLRSEGACVQVHGIPAGSAGLMEAVAQQLASPPTAVPVPPAPRFAALDHVGRSTAQAWVGAASMLAFTGESALALVACVAHPRRLRWRPILFNIRSAGVDALPIVGLLSFLLGVVVAYQAADQLRRYGANIFVADLVGLSMLREFAPLMTAIIIAGRSGSAYAAQIGTMAVTEEIDAMRTIGIAPLELLVLPKVIALVIALPLLTVFADLLGVFGGMVMARAQLGVSFDEFLDRFSKAISVTSYLIGIGKAPVFAAIIAMVGCYQGMRTRGGPDSVGRHTTRSVVQGIFLVIVADALFSVAFSLLEL